MPDEIPALIDKLITWVKGQSTQQPARSGVSGWVVGGLVAVVAFLGVALLYYRSWKQGAEMAKLQHEKDVRSEEIKQAAVTIAVTKNEAEVVKHRAVIVEALKKLDSIDTQMQAVDDKKARTIDEIGNLKSWRDVDHFTSGPPTIPPSNG